MAKKSKKVRQTDDAWHHAFSFSMIMSKFGIIPYYGLHIAIMYATEMFKALAMKK